LSIRLLKMFRIDPAVLPASEDAQGAAAVATNDSSMASRVGENARSRPTVQEKEKEKDTKVAENATRGLSAVSAEGGNGPSMRVAKDTQVSAAELTNGSSVASGDGGSVCSMPAI